jgi:hypothetical protein
MKFLQSFFLGFLAAIGALILEIAILSASSFTSSDVDISFKMDSVGHFFFLAILAEEFLKYFFLSKFVVEKKQSRTSILLSLVFGLGFSGVEMLLVYWNYRMGAGLDAIGMLGIIIIHVSTAIIMGVAIFKVKIRAFWGLLLGFIPAFIIHSAYNLLRVSEISQQKTILALLLVSLIIFDLFLLIKSKNEANSVNLAI